MDDLRKEESPQVILVMGKGGVGKTTLAVGLALETASAEHASVLVEFMDGESGGRLLKKSRNVRQVVIEPHKAIEELGTHLFRSQLVSKMVTGNFAMKRLFRAAPALRELAQLEAVRALADRAKGSTVVVDMPATGHGIAWLRVARQLEKLLVSGPLQTVAKRLSREFLTKERCAVVLVTLPERLVLRETLELADGLEREVDLRPRHILVNRVPSALPPGVLEELETHTLSPPPLGPAAKAFSKWGRARQQARDEALSLLTDLNPAEANTAEGVAQGTDLTLLPLSATDPTPGEVAAWLHDAGVP